MTKLKKQKYQLQTLQLLGKADNLDGATDEFLKAAKSTTSTTLNFRKKAEGAAENRIVNEARWRFVSAKRNDPDGNHSLLKNDFGKKKRSRARKRKEDSLLTVAKGEEELQEEPTDLNLYWGRYRGHGEMDGITLETW